VDTAERLDPEHNDWPYSAAGQYSRSGEFSSTWTMRREPARAARDRVLEGRKDFTLAGFATRRSTAISRHSRGFVPPLRRRTIRADAAPGATR